MFNEDGSLGPAGKLLEKKIESSFDTGENIRIDHALGLVDPYIYKKSSVFISNGYLDRGRFYANNISKIPNNTWGPPSQQPMYWELYKR